MLGVVGLAAPRRVVAIMPSGCQTEGARKNFVLKPCSRRPAIMLEAMRKTTHNSTNQNSLLSTRNLWPRHSSSRFLSVLILAALATGLRGEDWMTWMSTYTHSPQTGQRVDQYASGEQPISPYRQDFTRSGYRHFRSTLQAGQSVDNMHIVEQWGQPVLPYEQWRFPFRPYAVPYDAWGPQAPYGITNGSFQFGGGGNWGGGAGRPAPQRPGYGSGYGGGGYDRPGHPGQGGAGYPSSHPGGLGTGGPGHWGGYPPNAGYGPNGNVPNASRGFPLTPTYNNEPWYDGGYPSVPPLGER